MDLKNEMNECCFRILVFCILAQSQPMRTLAAVEKVRYKYTVLQ